MQETKRETAAARSTSDHQKISLADTLASLDATTEGLSDILARERLSTYGYNEIAERKTNQLLAFLLRFWGPMPWLLELAAALSLLLRHYLEAAIILLLLTVNAVIGHLHARGSQRAVDLLRKKLALKAKVLRGGAWVMRDAREIVPGDVIAVRLGDIVPADARILRGDLSIDEAALTGESLSVDRSVSGLVYSGAVVQLGEAVCVVVNTGANTFFGRTAELVKIAKPASHQNEVMMAIVKYMMYLGVAALSVVLLFGLLAHVEEHLLTVMTLAVILLMGAVPVALPAVLTIVQAVGAMQLADKGVLVTRLDSIEDAASIDILCLDKTGTITQNALAVADIRPFSGYAGEDVLRIAALASREEGMDAIDRAVLDHARKTEIVRGASRVVSSTPFSPATKRSEAVIEVGGERFRAVKGAAPVVLSLCSATDGRTHEAAEQAIEDLSRSGYRTLAVARSAVGDQERLILVGLLALADPARPDSREMITAAKRLGIKPMMLTGDSAAIAKEIAEQVGIGDNIVRLPGMRELPAQEQARLAASSDGFAEIYPEDKYRIVKLLQSHCHQVGMTGDGVNDAPALKQAEMGIAVGNATDVAKAAASIVLTEPGLSVIIDAVTISRKIYQRMLTWVINKVTKVIEFIGLITVAFLWLHRIPLSLLGMSLLVFANDFVTMSLATDNVQHTSNPNSWNVRKIVLASLTPGLFLVAEGLLVIWVGMNYFHLEWEQVRTLVMMNLVFNSQFRVLIVRERRHFWSSRPGRELLVLSAATIVAFSLFGVYGVMVPALRMAQILTILLFSGLFTLAIDFPKYYVFKRFGL
jgi:H+-transporting ATPase